MTGASHTPFRRQPFSVVITSTDQEFVDCGRLGDAETPTMFSAILFPDRPWFRRRTLHWF